VNERHLKRLLSEYVRYYHGVRAHLGLRKGNGNASRSCWTNHRLVGDVEVQDESTAVADDEVAIEHPKGDRWFGEEVHGRDRFPVVSKEGERTFGGLGTSRRPFHSTRDRSHYVLPVTQKDARHVRFVSPINIVLPRPRIFLDTEL